MITTANIAELGALVGDPGRANMLTALLDGRARTARELADCAGITPQTASGHLARLLAAGLLRVEQRGRHRHHRLASADVARMLEAMHIAAVGSAASRRTGPADAEMRLARSCYDHLAGQLGVMLADAIAEPGVDLRLSAAGEARLAAWGLDLGALQAGRRPFCWPCLDWSERRPHFAGTLGAAMLDRALTLGWLRRREDSRSLAISPAGWQGFADRFGVTLD